MGTKINRDGGILLDLLHLLALLGIAVAIVALIVYMTLSLLVPAVNLSRSLEQWQWNGTDGSH